MSLIDKIINFEKNLINSLENSKVPFIYFILTAIFATTPRIFMEIFSDHSTITWIVFLHYISFFISLSMLLVLLFHLATKTDILKVAKVILSAYIIIIIVPIIDLLLSAGKGYNLAYMLPGVHDNLLLRYYTFFGDFPNLGITPGMRIEIGIILLASFIYFYIKNSNLIKSIYYMLLTYTLIFAYLATPFILKAGLTALNLQYSEINLDMLVFYFYMVIIFFAGILLLYLRYSDYFMLIIRDIRPFRLLHYELMFIIGFMLGTKYTLFNLNYFNIFYFILIPISIAFAWLFSITTNNIEDYEIDKISNKNRPLVNSKMSLELYKKLAWFFLFIALFYAAITNFATFFIILLFIGNYFLYSMPPLKLKRIPFFSKLLISLNSLSLVMLGFFLAGNSIFQFPKIITAIFLIGFTAAINFIDIKDYEGDKKAGIKTLPVVLGLEKAKFIIGIFFILTYISVIFIIKDLYVIFLFFILGLLQFYLVNRKSYDEKPIFLVYFASLLILFYYLIYVMHSLLV